MIGLLIALLLAYQTQTICTLGNPVNWTQWADTNPEAEHVATIAFDNEMAWVYESDGDLFLFVFDSHRKPAAGDPDWHGACFRGLP